jgi:hypothetical protein
MICFFLGLSRRLGAVNTDFDLISKVLVTVESSRGELPERGELLDLHQTILRGAQLVERLRPLDTQVLWHVRYG